MNKKQEKFVISSKCTLTMSSSLLYNQFKLMQSANLSKQLAQFSASKYKSPQRSILKSTDLCSPEIRTPEILKEDAQKHNGKPTIKILKNTLRQKSQKREIEGNNQLLCKKAQKIISQTKNSVNSSIRQASCNMSSMRSGSINTMPRKNCKLGKQLLIQHQIIISCTRYLKTEVVGENLSKYLSFKDFLSFLLTSKKIYRKVFIKRRIKNTLLKGIFSYSRRKFWMKRSRAEELKNHDAHSYNYYINLGLNLSSDIEKDINRTFPPEHRFYSDPEKLKKLLNLLRGISAKNSDIGYIQGLNFIGGQLLLILPEEQAFWILDSFLNNFELKEFLKPSMPKMKLACYQLDQLLCKHLPIVYAELHSKEISCELFCIQWFITIFSSDFDSPFLYQIWDFFLVRKWKFIFQLSIAILKQMAVFIKVLDNEVLISHIKMALRDGQLSQVNSTIINF